MDKWCEFTSTLKRGEGEGMSAQRPASTKMEDIMDFSLPALAEEEEEK